MPRNYKSKVIDEQFSRIKKSCKFLQSKRCEALRKVKKCDKNSDKRDHASGHNPHQPKMSEVLQKHQKSILFANPNLKEIFNDPPMPALRQRSNLRKLLCRSNLYPLTRDNKLQRNTHKQAKCALTQCILTQK